jgi:hypothetical protein
MIETPADYRSFVFLSNKTAGLFAFARVTGVLFFYQTKLPVCSLSLGFPEFCFFIKQNC